MHRTIRYCLLILLILITGNAWGAKCTSTKTGNWSAFGTWSSATCTNASKDVPGTGTFANYSAVVSTGHTVTADLSANIYATVVEGHLLQGPGVTTSLTALLTIGNGAGKDGTFTFGAGSTLAMGANNFVVNNANIRSNATPSAWAIVTGTGAVTYGITNVKQSWRISYISWQNTGTHYYRLRSDVGAVTTEFLADHCAWHGTAAVTIGTGSYTPATTPITVNNSDFYDLTGNILFGDTGLPGSNVRMWNHNTMHQTTTKRSLSLGLSMTTDGTVFDGWDVPATSYGGIRHKNIFVSHRIGASGGTHFALIAATGLAPILEDSYFYSPATQLNSHGLAIGGTNAATATVQNSIFEYWGTEPNQISPGSNLNLDLLNNITISRAGSFLTIGSTTGTTNVKNNTVFFDGGTYSNGYGGLVLVENSNHTAALNITNNIQAVAVSTGTKDGAVGLNNATYTFNITSSDYNVWNGMSAALAYYNVDSVGGTTNDRYDINPSFVDSTRRFALWGATQGTDGTDTAAINKLLAINGYNATTKTQSDTPSGVTVADLVAWVRAGFTPTNSALLTAGEGGTYIGAVQPVMAGGADKHRGFEMGFEFSF